MFTCNLPLGEDCIGCAKTGSGKTAAFALPIIHKLALEPYGVYALVLTPTRSVKCLYCGIYVSLFLNFLSFRELAYQIQDQFNAFGKHIHIRVEVVVGGTGTHSNTIHAYIYNTRIDTDTIACTV